MLLGSIGRSDAALQLRTRGLPGMLGWGAGFLRNSSAVTFDRNAVCNLRLVSCPTNSWHMYCYPSRYSSLWRYFDENRPTQGGTEVERS